MPSTAADINPLADAARVERSPDPCVMVIFGASGDLTKRKLIPALFDLERQGVLPAGFTIVGVGRTPMDHNAFRSYLLEAMRTFGQMHDAEATMWRDFAACLHYIAVDSNIPEEFHRLRGAL